MLLIMLKVQIFEMQIKKSSKILFSLILCLLLMSIMTGCQKQSADFKYDSNRPKTEDGFDLAIKERDKNSHEADNAETENSEIGRAHV